MQPGSGVSTPLVLTINCMSLAQPGDIIARMLAELQHSMGVQPDLDLSDTGEARVLTGAKPVDLWGMCFRADRNNCLAAFDEQQPMAMLVTPRNTGNKCRV